MTSAHIFFIPGMIMIGMFLGFIFGARAARNQMDIQRRRDEERDLARAARAAKRAASGDKQVDTPPPAEAASKEAETDLPEKADDKSEAKKPDGGNKGKGGKGKRAS